MDWTLCQGHGLCADIIPDVIELGIDGYPAKAAMEVPGGQRPQALRAVRRCPRWRCASPVRRPRPAAGPAAPGRRRSGGTTGPAAHGFASSHKSPAR
ncbi:ferredoxin [Streptomyces sp. M19]